MIYSGKISDSTGNPIPGSAIAFVNDTGQQIVSMPTNGAGQWSVDDNFDSGLFGPGMSIRFRAPGFYEYGISSDSLPQVYNVKLQQKANTVLPWMVAAVASAILIYRVSERKKGRKVGKFNTKDLYPLFLILGGVIGFTVLKKILEGLGLWQSADDKKLKEISQDAGSFWNPNYWQTIKPSGASYTYALTEQQAHDFAIQVYDGLGFIYDDEPQVKSVFRNMITKANVSFVAWEFQKLFGRDLLSFLKSGKLGLPWQGLSSSDIVEINSFINSLPNY